jgi:hypothetical protein
MQVDYNERTQIVVRNVNVAARVLTIAVADAAKPDGLPVTGRQITIPANTTVAMVIGPLPTAYRQADGKIWLNFDIATDVTVGVLQDS